MKDTSYKENNDKNIKFKSFKELEEEFKDINLDDFKKSQLNEFKEKELSDFKNFLKESKMDLKLQSLRSRLKSDDAIKKVIKELDKIGLNGRSSLKLLQELKRY